MTGYPSPSTPEPLHIVCPPSKQPMTVVFSCAALCMLGMSATRLFNGPPERFSWFKVWVLVLMGTFFYAILYRNLFVRDELYLYRDKPEEWAAGDEDMLVLAAASVRSVRVGPRPGPYTAEAKEIAMGIGDGLIEIETTDGCYRFGAGLSEDIANARVRQIAVYCGLQEVGPLWKAVSDIADGQA